MRNSVVFLSLLVAISLSVLAQGGRQDAAPRNSQSMPLAISDALMMRSFSATAQTPVVALSHDGKSVAFVTQDSRRSRGLRVDQTSVFTATGTPTVVSGCDIQITDIRTGTTKNLTRGFGSNWGPVWSPDGKRLAFYSDRGGRQTVWLWERASGKLWQVARVIARPRYGWELVRWSHDSRKLLVKALPAGTKLPGGADKPDKAPVISIYRTDNAPSPSGAQLDAWAQADVTLLDAETGRVTRIAQAVHPCWYEFAPDDKSIAFATAVLTAGKITQELRLVSTPSGASRTLARHLQLGFPATSVSWSPEGQRLAYVSPNGKGRASVFLVATGDAATHELSLPAVPTNGLRAPVWDQSGGCLYAIVPGEAQRGDSVWKLPVDDAPATRLFHAPQQMLTGLSAHQQLLLARTFHQTTKQTGFLRLDPATAQTTAFGTGDFSYTSQGLLTWAALFMNASANGQQIAYLSESAIASPDVWLADTATGATRRLTQLNPQLAPYVFGASRQIEYVSDDGETLQGALLLPAGYQPGRRYPLVVWVMESTRGSHNLNRFGLIGHGVDNLQLLATRGYAVLFADSQGKAGEAARNLAVSIPAAVQKAVELGIADPTRVGVMGFSYGAYSTALLITRTDLFKAAIVRGGYYNAVSQYGQMSRDGMAAWTGILEAGHNIHGNPWGQRERFIENSPIFHLDKVQTPVLIISGAADTAARSSQAEELFVGLRRLGKKAEYVRYEGEEHYEAHWSLVHQYDYCQRMIKWFEEYLKPQP